MKVFNYLILFLFVDVINKFSDNVVRKEEERKYFIFVFFFNKKK